MTAEYVELVDRENLERLPVLDRDAFLAVSAFLGEARLIDNVYFDIDAIGTVNVDRGTKLTAPSVLST